MRTLANLFLFLFFADGVLSFADELSGPGTLSDFRVFWASVVLFLCLPMYLSLGIDRRLPKRIFLPQVIFLFLAALVPWAVPGWLESGAFGLGAAGFQVVLGLLPLALKQPGGHRSLALSAALFRRPGFSWKHTLAFVGINLFVLPVALGLLGVAGVAAFVEEHTSGYVRLAPEGIYMTERVYTHEDKTIRLAGMVHVGGKDYYEDLSASIPAGPTLVLAEGVADAQGMLRNRFSYGKMANALGLESQEQMHFEAREVGAADLESSGFVPGAEGIPDIMHADVDLKTFHPITLAFLNELGRQMSRSDSLLETIHGFNAWAEENLTEQANRELMDDILHSRNRALIAHIDPALKRYPLLVIPWGALHMPEIERAVLDRGFEQKQSLERLSIDFRKITFGNLLKAQDGTE